jgi:ADP-ribosylglycohydrolase
MIGAIVGDVLGSVYEAWSTKRKDFTLFHELARPTDDSVLTVAVARVILESDGAPTVDDYARLYRALGRRYPDAGYGGTFYRWLHDPAMGPYNSWGNGSAMRSSPVGWAYDSEDEVVAQAELTALPTHNHPHGVAGAQAVALAVFLARTRAGKEEIRASIARRFGYDLTRTVAQIRPTYGFQVSCQDSVPEAIICFLDSTNVEDAIRNAISLGGDADTQACIAGAIAEAHYGGVPEDLLSFVLPRLDDELLGVVLDFAKRFLPSSTASALERERDSRRVSRAGRKGNALGAGRAADVAGRAAGSPTTRGRAPRYQVLVHGESWRRIEGYAKRVLADPAQAGTYMRARLPELPTPQRTAEGVFHALVNTKKPRIFAESEVAGDGSDWTTEELRLLGDVAISVPVTIFDDGLHTQPRVHEPPFGGTLLFVPGALLRSGHGMPADWSVVQDDRINQEAYEALYERRLLPALKLAGSTALSRGTQAFVTIPGLGCGQFAGEFRGTLGVRLREAIRSILTRHARQLPGIRAVWYDPYSECQNERHEIGGVSYLVRPLRHSHPQRPQLCRPEEYAGEGEDLSGCELWSMVAWDHVSWPGNDFYAGSRATDDGVKAAATDSMFAMTGVRGSYDADRNAYLPPAPYGCWEEVVLQHKMTIRTTGNLVIAGGAEGVPHDTD